MNEEIKRVIENYKSYENSKLEEMNALYEERNALVKRALKMEEVISSLNRELKNKKEWFKKKIKKMNNQNKGLNPVKVKFRQEHWPLLDGYCLQVDRIDTLKEVGAEEKKEKKGRGDGLELS